MKDGLHLFPPQTGRHTYAHVKKNTQTHARTHTNLQTDTHVSSRMGQESKPVVVSLYTFTPTWLHQDVNGIVTVWQVRRCVFQTCPMMFVSTAGGFCDEAKDALEPAVSHLQVTSRIKAPSTKLVWGALKELRLALASGWRMKREIFWLLGGEMCHFPRKYFDK